MTSLTKEAVALHEYLALQANREGATKEYFRNRRIGKALGLKIAEHHLALMRQGHFDRVGSAV